MNPILALFARLAVINDIMNRAELVAFIPGPSISEVDMNDIEGRHAENTPGRYECTSYHDFA
jgi:hypothetical protein